MDQGLLEFFGQPAASPRRGRRSGGKKRRSSGYRADGGVDMRGVRARQRWESMSASERNAQIARMRAGAARAKLARDGLYRGRALGKNAMARENTRIRAQSPAQRRKSVKALIKSPLKSLGPYNRGLVTKAQGNQIQVHPILAAQMFVQATGGIKNAGECLQALYQGRKASHLLRKGKDNINGRGPRRVSPNSLAALEEYRQGRR